MSNENEQNINQESGSNENENTEKKDNNILLILLLIPIIIPILIYSSIKLYKSQTDQVYQGGPISNVFKGGNGHDVYFSHMESDDTYIYNIGDGCDYIEDIGGEDTIKFGKGITIDNLEFVSSYGSLWVGVKTEQNSDGGLTIEKFFSDPDHRIEKFEFEDGTVITDITPYVQEAEN